MPPGSRRSRRPGRAGLRQSRKPPPPPRPSLPGCPAPAGRSPPRPALAARPPPAPKRPFCRKTVDNKKGNRYNFLWLNIARWAMIGPTAFHPQIQRESPVGRWRREVLRPPAVLKGFLLRRGRQPPWSLPARAGRSAALTRQKRRQPFPVWGPCINSGALRGFGSCNLGGTTERPSLRPCFGGEGYSFLRKWRRNDNAMDRSQRTARKVPQLF